jgi:hypothetical protein
MSTVKELDKQGLLKRNFHRPPLKDTTTVPVGGYTIIRFLTSNPGTWMFHCHQEFHSEIGMALLVKLGQKKDLPSEPENWPQCGNFKFTENGAVKPTSYEKAAAFFYAGIFNLLCYKLNRK